MRATRTDLVEFISGCLMILALLVTGALLWFRPLWGKPPVRTWPVIRYTLRDRHMRLEFWSIFTKKEESEPHTSLGLDFLLGKDWGHRVLDSLVLLQARTG